MPCVSVVIPFYRRADWLEDAVSSVLSQTFSDFEIIIVNDGSSEASVTSEVLNDKRIKYFEQENMGPAGARNTGISQATGKYIAFLDSDDLFVPGKLETQVQTMEENPDVALSHTSYTRITSEGENIDNVDSGGFSGNVYPQIISHCPIATPTVMIRHDAIKSLKFVETARAGEDIMFWLRISKESRIIGIRENLSKVRIHGNNAAFNPEIVLDASLKVIDYAYECDPGLKVIFRRKATSRIYYCVSYMYLKSKERCKAAKLLSKGIYYYPIGLSNYLLALLIVLPYPLSEKLKRVKDDFRSKKRN